MKAWNGWYHVNGNTYGTWLRGDPRGWRSRWHREHVEGDYKHPPPPGMYEAQYQQSKRAMKKPPVHLDDRQRRVAVLSMVEKLVEVGTEVIAASMDSCHYHILARFSDAQVRRRVGLAKKHASHTLSRFGLAGVVWARKNHDLPIRNRRHQVNVFNYIKDHAAEGAFVWMYNQGLYWLKDTDAGGNKTNG